jgi:hypothetical protein
MTPRTPRELRTHIAASPELTARLFDALARLGLEHSGHVSTATLALLCDVNPRTWRRWEAAGTMPLHARRSVAWALEEK